MTWSGTPWFVDGAQHDPELARLIAYLASGGGGGIVAPGDCKVTASTIPDNKIHIAPGGIAALNAGEGGASQSYVDFNTGDDERAITPNGPGADRYDLVAWVVEDPQYAGQPAPASIPNGPYDRTRIYEGVAATTLFLSDVDADQTGEALALIKVPPSTGTITDSMITDLRRLAVTKSETVKRMNTYSGAADPMPTSTAGAFPQGASWTIPIPSWANRVSLSALVSGILGTDTGTGGGSAGGDIIVSLGSIDTPAGKWRFDAPATGKKVRVSAQAAEDGLTIPSAMRGRTATLKVRAVKTSGTGLTVVADDGTTVIAEAVFTRKVS